MGEATFQLVQVFFHQQEETGTSQRYLLHNQQVCFFLPLVFNPSKNLIPFCVTGVFLFLVSQMDSKKHSFFPLRLGF